MDMFPDVIIKTHGLRKTFKVGFWGRSVTALQQLDLEVRRGEVFGFLGPNGAGKTTTLKILMGLIYPTAGKAWLFDREIGDTTVKHQIGFLPESPYFYDYLTAIEFLRFYGQLFEIKEPRLGARIEELLVLVGLSHARHLPLRKFSKGMLQRIGIAQALINDPQLVVLDEPMSGLDPVGRKEVRDLILKLKESGKTIFFSSHILHDAELLCDRVGILLGGRLVATGRVNDLVGNASTDNIEVVVEGLREEGLAHVTPLTVRTMAQGDRTLLIVKGQEQVNRVLDVIRAAKAQLVSLTPQKGSLEDLFMRQVREEKAGRA
ncbi:ABC transporter ATP-binding protein [Candidatus Nitrospira bockiana]